MQELRTLESTLPPASNARAPEAADEFWSASYFPPLDGVRALSVLMVVAAHIPSVATLAGYRYAWVGEWVHGWVGVFVFFVLSGFLITTLLLREERGGGTVSLRSFYWRRVFRIFPAYYAVLALYVVVCQLPVPLLRSKWGELRQGLPYFLFYANEYVPESVGTAFSHSWSLGVEEKFYLVWPFLFFIAMRVPAQRMVALAGGLLLLALFPSHLPSSYFSLGVGCALAFFLEYGRHTRWVSMARRVPPVAMLPLVVGSYALVHVDKRFTLLFSVAIALFLMTLVLRPSGTRRVLSAPAFVWLGKRSYSMYLLHVLSLNVVLWFFPVKGVASFCVVLFGGYAVAALAANVLYRVLEQPMVQLGKRKREEPIAAIVGASPDTTI